MQDEVSLQVGQDFQPANVFFTKLLPQNPLKVRVVTGHFTTKIYMREV